MPFSCTFQLNHGAINELDKVIFIDFIHESFGKYQEKKVKIAKIFFNDKPAFIYSNCPCFPSALGMIKSGDQITSETKIGFFSAEGEDIPYNRPYAKIGFD